MFLWGDKPASSGSFCFDTQTGRLPSPACGISRLRSERQSSAVARAGARARAIGRIEKRRAAVPNQPDPCVQQSSLPNTHVHRNKRPSDVIFGAQALAWDGNPDLSRLLLVDLPLLLLLVRFRSHEGRDTRLLVSHSRTI